MVELKSNELSIRYKEEGNQELLKKNRKHALVLYNKAICYAESKENLALAYANRSLVFFVRGLYDECLLNIKWARENGYPEDKIQKLNEREKEANKLKAAQVKDPVEDPWNFIKLSHPANPKIPFIVDCLEMKKTEKFGRGIYATRDISTGDILSIEDSISQNISYTAGDDFFYCGNCLKTCRFNLIPCLNTAVFMFCSETCRESLYNKIDVTDSSLSTKSSVFDLNQVKFHGDIEEKFGGREKFLEFLKTVPDIRKLDSSVFDFDWSDPNDPEYGANQIKCLLSYVYDFDLFNRFKGIKSSSPCLTDETETLKHFIEHAFGIMVMQSKVDLKVTLGSAFGTLINHSCVPNVQRIQIDTKVAYYATKPISAGEQIFACYSMESTTIACHFLDMYPEFRQEFIENAYAFKCGCRACKDDLGPEDAVIIDVKEVKESHMKFHAAEILASSGSLKPLLDHWRANNKYITKHHENILSKDVHFLMAYNYQIIDAIAGQCE